MSPEHRVTNDVMSRERAEAIVKEFAVAYRALGLTRTPVSVDPRSGEKLPVAPVRERIGVALKKLGAPAKLEEIDGVLYLVRY